MSGTNLGYGQLALTTDFPTEYRVVSAIPVNLSDVVRRDKRTYICAEIVNVTGIVSTSGHDLEIVCRSILFGDGSKIDASGIDGTPSFAPGIKAVTAGDFGARGQDGQDGGNGSSAGNITITCMTVVGIPVIIANGGAAGRGQDGGDGRNGRPGSNGEDCSALDGGNFPEKSIGKNGGNGGDVGLPGRSGKPGAGGNFTLQFVEDHSQNLVQNISIAGGKPSQPAQSGKPGLGGKGGVGGLVRFMNCPDIYFTFNDTIVEYSVMHATGLILPDLQLYKLSEDAQVELAGSLLNASILRDPPDRPRPCRHIRTDRAPSGANGATGASRLNEVSEKQQTVTTPDGSIQASKIGKDIFSNIVGDIFLSLFTIYVENLYKSSEIGSGVVESKVTYLLELCVNNTTHSGTRNDSLARAYSMAEKIKFGFDFYGYSETMAPLVSYEAYARLFDLTYRQSQYIEEKFHEFFDKNATLETRKNSIRLSIQTSENHLSEIISKFNSLTNEAQFRLKDIDKSEDRLKAIFILLMAKERELTLALNQKSQGCNTLETLVAVGTIVAGISSGGTALIGAASAGSELYKNMSDTDSLKELWANRNKLSENLKDITNNANDFSTSVAAIRREISGLTAEQKSLPNFRIEREQFESIAREFTDIPAAAAYRDTGIDYLNQMQSRNEAILDYNAMILQLVDLQATKNSVMKSRDVLGGSLISESDITSMYVLAAMNRLYMDTLAFTGYIAHQSSKALSYQLGRESEAPISCLNLSAVYGGYQQVQRRWIDSKERYSAIRTIKNPINIKLSKIVSKITWEAFKKNKNITFTISRNNHEYAAIFDALMLWRITGVEIKFHGAKVITSEKTLPWVLVHCGSEIMYRSMRQFDGDGKYIPGSELPVYFSHKNVPITGLSKLDGSEDNLIPDFTQNGLYAGVSPFASWQLYPSRIPELGVDLSRLSEVELRVWGYSLSGL